MNSIKILAIVATMAFQPICSAREFPNHLPQDVESAVEYLTELGLLTLPEIPVEFLPKYSRQDVEQAFYNYEVCGFGTIDLNYEGGGIRIMPKITKQNIDENLIIYFFFNDDGMLDYTTIDYFCSNTRKNLEKALCAAEQRLQRVRHPFVGEGDGFLGDKYKSMRDFRKHAKYWRVGDRAEKHFEINRNLIDCYITIKIL